jgi:hypothetical protein
MCILSLKDANIQQLLQSKRQIALRRFDKQLAMHFPPKVHDMQNTYTNYSTPCAKQILLLEKYVTHRQDYSKNRNSPGATNEVQF